MLNLTRKPYTILHKDCKRFCRQLRSNTIDTVITDPPYGLKFMGKEWDHGIPSVEFWRAFKRVCKPGAMLLAFGGTRTFHRLACANVGRRFVGCDNDSESCRIAFQRIRNAYRKAKELGNASH